MTIRSVCHRLLVSRISCQGDLMASTDFARGSAFRARSSSSAKESKTERRREHVHCGGCERKVFVACAMRAPRPVVGH